MYRTEHGTGSPACPAGLYCLLLVFLLVFICFPVYAASDSAKTKYFKADACYAKIQKSAAKKKYRHNWLNCIEKYEAVYEHDTDGPWAAAGLFMCGKLYYGLSIQSGLESDLKEARDIFERIVRRYPKSKYKDRAEQELRSIAKKLPSTGAAEEYSHASDSITTLIRENTASSGVYLPVNTGKPTTVENIRTYSNPHYTRVVIDADRETTFAHKYLRIDPSIGKPHRLFVELTNSRVGADLPKHVPINDDLLISARAAQNTPEQVRVVVDIKSYERYNVFHLKDPFRIVIDVWGENGAALASRAGSSSGSSGTVGELGPNDLARQLSLNVRRIIVDPGHGGKDYGAPGYVKGVHEKDVVLAISKKLAEKLRRELGCEVILTRTKDVFLTLEERTAIANTENADLFISVHTNSHGDQRARGIETYFLNLATDDDAIRVAAIENATSEKNISDLESILNDLMHNMKVNESSRLAGYVQNAMCNGLNRKYSRINNKGVKQAPFYVLLGAQMPAILVETSFISNKVECNRLTSSDYQDAMVQSIMEGVKRYIDDTKSVAFFHETSEQG